MLDLIKSYKYYIVLVFLMLAGGIIAAVATSGVRVTQSDLDNSVKEYKDKDFPQIALANFDNSLDLSTELKRGKTLLIYLSADCGGCRTEMELLSQSRLPEDFGIQILLVGFESREKLDAFKNTYNIGYPIFYDVNYVMKESLNIGTVPANYLIVDGKIKRSWFGTPFTLPSLYENLGLVSTDKNNSKVPH